MRSSLCRKGVSVLGPGRSIPSSFAPSDNASVLFFQSLMLVKKPVNAGERESPIPDRAWVINAADHAMHWTRCFIRIDMCAEIKSCA